MKIRWRRSSRPHRCSLQIITSRSKSLSPINGLTVLRTQDLPRIVKSPNVSDLPFRRKESNASKLLGASSDKPKSNVARLALRKQKQRQRLTFAFALKNPGQTEIWNFSNVMEAKTLRRDRPARMKLGTYSKRTRKSVGSLASRRLGPLNRSQLPPVEPQKTKQSAKRLLKKSSDLKLTLADLSGTKHLVDIADLCRQV